MCHSRLARPDSILLRFGLRKRKDIDDHSTSGNHDRPGGVFGRLKEQAGQSVYLFYGRLPVFLTGYYVKDVFPLRDSKFISTIVEQLVLDVSLSQTLPGSLFNLFYTPGWAHGLPLVERLLGRGRKFGQCAFRELANLGFLVTLADDVGQVRRVESGFQTLELDEDFF